MLTTQKRINTDIPLSNIIGVQFSMLSADEIRRNSVVEVKSKETHNGNKPAFDGLFDLRMGPLEPGSICPVDGLTHIDCPGYFGRIELPKPVLFIQHLKEIQECLQCVCLQCSKLLIDKETHRHILSRSGDDRLDYTKRVCAKISLCGQERDDGCGCPKPKKIEVRDMATIIATIQNGDQTEEHRLYPEMILKIFKRISDDDMDFMGFNHVWSRPESMICQVLPVPPPAMRPSVKQDAQQRSEDDITQIYMKIIGTCQDLTKYISENASSDKIEGVTNQLQYYIAMIVNNKIKNAEPLAQRSGRVLQCIMSRINHKFGRIRYNLMGKRVDYSARSVITGDPNLSIQQIGVPMAIAKNLTVPVVVNDRNRKYLTTCIRNGPDVHPGAKTIKLRNGTIISLRNADVNAIELQNGDIVNRHMIDDDIVLFNRQPSLHKMSMMAHRAKIMKKGDTFRFNVGCTKPYNADEILPQF